MNATGASIGNYIEPGRLPPEYTLARSDHATDTYDTIEEALASARLKESAKERHSFIRDADDLICCLAIEFEIELGRGLTVVPVGKVFELGAPQRPLRESGSSDADAHTRRLPSDTALLGHCFGGSHNAARDEALPSLVFARETKTVSPSVICLPPYIVFCAVNSNVFARGPVTSALIANATLARYREDGSGGRAH